MLHYLKIFHYSACDILQPDRRARSDLAPASTSSSSFKLVKICGLEDDLRSLDGVAAGAGDEYPAVRLKHFVGGADRLENVDFGGEDAF